MQKLVVFLLLVTATGCGSSGDGSPGPVAPDARKSTLVVDVRGLPAGLPAAAVLQNVSSGVNVTASTTLTGLTPGTYSFVVQPVEDANARFAPTIATRQVTLGAGETQSIVIDYAEITGRVVLVIDGLAAGAATTIDVAGPANFTARLSQADTLRRLTPGTYTITAASTAGTSRFLPDSAVRSIRVDSARIVSVIVRFHPVAQLTIQIDGLPTGVEASVDVVGAAFSQHLTAGATFSDLPLAAYVVTPSTVSVGSDVYRATVQSTTLSFGGSNTIAIRYVRQFGSISIRILGGPVLLGAPALPIVTVNGPGGSFSLSRDAMLEGLPFGIYRYAVTAPRYRVYGTGGYYNNPRGAVYSSTLDGRSDLAVTLDSLQPALTVDVPLSFVSGSVIFTAPGSQVIPNSTTLLTLSDSLGTFFGFVSTGDISRELPAGTYTDAPSDNGSYEDWWLPDVASTTATVSAAFPVAAVVISYHKMSWPTITFAYSGMPAGMYLPIDVISTDRSYLRGQYLVPNTMPRWGGSFPGPKHIDFPMPVLSADTSAAWVGPTGGIDFFAPEGQTTTVTIPMRETNVFQIIPTGIPNISTLPPGSIVVTLPNGNSWDISASLGQVLSVDRPAGTHVVKANPIQVGTTTYVPALGSQVISLPATGRTIVRITYSAQ